MPEVWVLTEEIHDGDGDAYVVHAVCSSADLAQAFVADNGLAAGPLDWKRSPDPSGSVRWAEWSDAEEECEFRIEGHWIDAWTPASDGEYERRVLAEAKADRD